MLPTEKEVSQGIIIKDNKIYKKEKFKDQKVILIDYLKMKTEEEDWHGVADAAMDLRELEVKIAFTSGQGKTS